MIVVSDKMFVTPGEFGDFVHIYGGTFTFKRCVFSGKYIKPDQMDELVGITRAAKVTFEHCRFEYGGKAVLLGSGDENEADMLDGLSAYFYECIFDGNSRRHPYVNAGKARLNRCLIKNWGIPDSFYVKSTGARANSQYALLEIDQCIFEQENLWTCLTRGNLIADTVNHPLIPFLGPGFRRGAYSENDAEIYVTNCYKNRPWIYLENHQGDYMTKEQMLTLKEHLEVVVPTLDTN